MLESYGDATKEARVVFVVRNKRRRAKKCLWSNPMKQKGDSAVKRLWRATGIGKKEKRELPSRTIAVPFPNQHS